MWRCSHDHVAGCQPLPASAGLYETCTQASRRHELKETCFPDNAARLCLAEECDEMVKQARPYVRRSGAQQQHQKQQQHHSLAASSTAHQLGWHAGSFPTLLV